MSKNTITVKNYVKIREEYVAVAAITPGNLVEVTSAGKVQKHSTAGGNVLPMIAIEDAMQGKLITGAYAADDQVQVWVPTRGDIANMLLANGETVVIGDFLESDGLGQVRKHVADSAGAVEAANPIVGVALEAVDMSGSDGVDPDGRILVRIV